MAMMIIQEISSRLINFSGAEDDWIWRICCAGVQPSLFNNNDQDDHDCEAIIDNDRHDAAADDDDDNTWQSEREGKYAGTLYCAVAKSARLFWCIVIYDY